SAPRPEKPRHLPAEPHRPRTTLVVLGLERRCRRDGDCADGGSEYERQGGAPARIDITHAIMYTLLRFEMKDRAYTQLRDLIVSGRIPPGSRLIEVEFARRLSVSRTPTREAMRRLAQGGLAQIVGDGAKTQIAVAPVTRDDLLDLFNIIGALEGIA